VLRRECGEYQHRFGEYLDELARRNLKIIYSIKDVYGGHPLAPEPSCWAEENIVARWWNFRDHPALLAWYLNDECAHHARPAGSAPALVSQLDQTIRPGLCFYQVDDLYG